MQIFDPSRAWSAAGVARLALAASLLLTVAGSAPALARPPEFKSPEQAFEQGIGAYRARHPELAIPALEFAAARQNFLAQFYLARIYGSNSGPETDHAKAYILYQHIANENADIDPEDNHRAPFVAKSLVALARYLLVGVPEAFVKPDAERAAQYLQHAATFFDDQDAQFELSKLFLSGEGVPADPKRAIYWLTVLGQRGHVGAQAFLADQTWRGKFIPADPHRALALITLALENASPGERIWIEDIYQSIFCGASKGVRQQADGLVADWRQRYVHPTEPTPQVGEMPTLVPEPPRTCSNGELVMSHDGNGATASRKGPDTQTLLAAPATGALPPMAPSPTTGAGAVGVGAVGVGMQELEPPVSTRRGR